MAPSGVVVQDIGSLCSRAWEHRSGGSGWGMSRARLVVTAVVVEGRARAGVAASCGLSRSRVTKLVARWRAVGDTAFEPRSRRPRTSPRAVAAEAAELIVNLRADLDVQGLDAGPHTIAWHLQAHHGIVVSPSTIRRRLVAAGLVDPSPEKRPKSSYARFEADLPNECWQSGFTRWRLAGGATTEVITWLDDHSRHALSVTAHRRATGPIVVDTFNKTASRQGLPASVLTDNAMVCTARSSGGKGGRNALETLLGDLGIAQKHSAPNHPTTGAKVEREVPANPQEMAHRPNPRRHHRPAPKAPRRLHRHLQPPKAPPQPQPPNTRRRLQPPPQNRTSPKRSRNPLARPPRPRRQNRCRHPATQRQTPPHRHRPTTRRNPQHPPHRRPPHPHRQHPNRRTPTPPHPQPRTRLPTTKQTLKPPPRRFTRFLCLDTSQSTLTGI